MANTVRGHIEQLPSGSFRVPVKAATACAVNPASTVTFPIARTLPACPAERVPNWRICASAGPGTRSANACKYSALGALWPVSGGAL